MNHKFIWVCCALLIFGASGTGAAAPSSTPELDQLLSPLTLSQCMEIAFKQNQKRRISKLAVDTAEYQHKQALSSFWPQLSFETAYSRLDEDVNFIFPENTYSYDITVPGLGSLSGETTVPEQDVTISDAESVVSNLKMTYPLFTGGLRSSTAQAADSNVRAARHAMRRTDMELMRDVQRMYYGAVLAQRLAAIGGETLTRLRTTTDLTERLYKAGSGSVTKLDYLRSMVILDSAQSVVETLRSNVTLSLAALGNTMGVRWETPIQLAEKAIPFVEMALDLDALVSGAYRFNPDWKQLAEGLVAAEALVKKEQSGHWPKVALTGTLWRWDNDLDNSGLSTEQNENGWSIGVGMQVPLFSGFMTSNKIKEAKARLKQMEAKQILLKEGIALQVKNSFIGVARTQKVRAARMRAAQHAREHRELAINAYMNELVTTEVVLESQIFEAMARAYAETAQYEHAIARFDIDYVVGKEVHKLVDIGN